MLEKCTHMLNMIPFLPLKHHLMLPQRRLFSKQKAFLPAANQVY